MSTRETLTSIDAERAAAALSDIGEIAGRVGLAAKALAEPLLALRAGQAWREADRAAAAGDRDEARAREAAAGALDERLTLLRAEIERARVTPRAPAGGQAAIRGRILRGGAGVADARIVAEAAGKRAANACADAAGRFTIDVPADIGVVLSVSMRGGGVVHRDGRARRYAVGQMAVREIELDDATAPCDPPRARRKAGGTAKAKRG